MFMAHAVYAAQWIPTLSWVGLSPATAAGHLLALQD